MSEPFKIDFSITTAKDLAYRAAASVFNSKKRVYKEYIGIDFEEFKDKYCGTTPVDHQIAFKAKLRKIITLTFPQISDH